VGAVLELAAVLDSGALAEAVAAVALIALDPVGKIGAQGDLRTGLELAAEVVGLAGGLDRAGLGHRATRLLALLAGGAVDDDVGAGLRAGLAEDPRRCGLDE
jgi:hypothetical protein